MKTMIIYALMFAAGVGYATAQTITVRGTVTAADDGQGLPGVGVTLKGTKTGTVTDAHGAYSLTVPSQGGTLVFAFVGYKTKEEPIRGRNTINVTLEPDMTTLNEVVVTGYGKRLRGHRQETDIAYERMPSEAPAYHPAYGNYDYAVPYEHGNEEYAEIEENTFHGASGKPLSTFSIDVDVASYANVRRFINNGQTPPADAVRIEEMINYFSYAYPEPDGRHPFSVTTEMSAAPWNDKHQLVRIGLQGRHVSMEDLPPSNLVFLIDVSGSMNQVNKLPLVKKSFKLLVEQLRPEDHVSIVVYAGAVGTVLEPTPGDDKRKILAALELLQPGGSTAGAAGLRMAYALAAKHYKDGGNNRVILATDGDFNVGESSNEAMEDLIEEKRKEGVFLTVLGFGMGNLKDSKMELLADKGNGNYAYIDNLTEARKVLVSEFGGTLFTIAKDVKLQIEFNPARVEAYRLLGYENRKLRDEDFNNDRKDAGELGSGHSVTALYEIIPVGVNSDYYSIDKLKYQPVRQSSGTAASSDDWLTVKLRYKDPDGSESRLLEHVLSGEPLSRRQTSDDFRWAASVAAFGMLLRDSPYANGWSYADVIAQAQAARGADREGYRSEFINLVKTHGLLAEN